MELTIVSMNANVRIKSARDNLVAQRLLELKIYEIKPNLGDAMISLDHKAGIPTKPLTLVMEDYLEELFQLDKGKRLFGSRISPGV